MTISANKANEKKTRANMSLLAFSDVPSASFLPMFTTPISIVTKAATNVATIKILNPLMGKNLFKFFSENSMTKYLKTRPAMNKYVSRFALIGALMLVTPLAAAQERQESNGALVPNLTVNIKLNSALGEKETEFYSKIAQELISKLPRELSVDKQADALQDLDEAYKHLNVVTYLPPSEDVSTDKMIKHFKVNFVFDDEEGAKSADEAQDIILPEALKGETIVGLKEPDTNEDQVASTEPNENDSMIDRMVKSSGQPVEPKPAPVVAPKPEPKPEPVVEAPKPEPKPVVVAAAPKPKPVRRAPAPTKQVNKVRLAFDTDETNLSVSQRVELMKFIQKLRNNTTKQPDGFVFVVRSYEGPIGVEDNLGESRLRSVTALLRQQDINVSRSRVTEIFVRTNDQQFVEVEPVY